MTLLVFDFCRPVIKALYTGAATFFLLFVFALVKDLRDNTLSTSFASSALTQQDLREYLLSMGFDGFKQTVDTLIYYSQESPRWGANFLGLILFGCPAHSGLVNLFPLGRS